MISAEKVLLTLFFLFYALSMNAQQSISGIWDMGQENTKIEIKANNGDYEGRIASSDNAKAKIGNLILKDVKSLGGKWKGKLFSPKKQEWFDAFMEVKGNLLLVTIKSGWMTKTVEWTKK